MGSPSLLLQESFPSSNTDDDEHILKSAKIIVYQDDYDKAQTIYEVSVLQQKQNNNTNIGRKGTKTSVYEARISSFTKLSDTVTYDVITAYDAACQMIDNVLQYILTSELNDEDEKEWEIKLNFSKENSALFEAAIHRGFVEIVSPKIKDPSYENNITMEWKNPCQATRSLTEYTFTNRGESKGFVALEILSLLCSQRIPYTINEIEDSTSDSHQRGNGHNRVLSTSKKLVPKNARNEVNSIMDIIKRNRWLSTNLDSVDMTPSLHLNLISGGKPLFENNGDNRKLSMIDGDSGVSFEENIEKIRMILEPYLYDELLPTARNLIQSESLEISDVFLRSYGENVQGKEEGISEDDETNHENTRLGISSHYDVYSTLTSVIAMDDVAADGKRGLYTVLSPQLDKSSKKELEKFKHISVSNHASLRRFFPLEAGDAVLHTWDILHGVDIEPSKSRTSLIVWFTDYKNKNNIKPSTKNKQTTSPPPWLIDPDDNDDIGNFVLASAVQSSDYNDGDLGIELSSIEDDTNGLLLDNDSPISKSSESRIDPQQLYLKSARMGNSFGLCRMGSYSDDGMLDSKLSKDALVLLQELNHISTNQFQRKNNYFLSRILKNDDNNKNSNQQLAKAFWYESAMRGNPLAQLSLADACMEEFMESSMEDDDAMLMATVLFAMAAQQKFDGASESLKRVFGVYASTLTEEERQEEEISQSSIMQTVIAAQMGGMFQ